MSPIYEKDSECYQAGLTDEPCSEAGIRESRKQNLGGGTTPATINETDTINVFIFIGQSNMLGVGKKELFREKFLETDEQCLRLEHYEEGGETRIGFYLQEPNEKYNGPEISFAHYLANEFRKAGGDIAGQKIGIIKSARGGTGIRAWLPEQAYHEDAEYTYEKAGQTDDICKGPLYRLIREKINWLKETYPPEESTVTINFAGVFLKQGEKDMHKEVTAENYWEQVRHVIRQIRMDTESPDIPLYVCTYWSKSELIAMEEGGVREVFGTDDVRPYSYTVLDQHASMHRLHNTHVIPHGWLPAAPDNSHFSTESQEVFGCLLAAHVMRSVIPFPYSMEYIRWFLSGEVMPSPDYGSADIPGSDIDSILTVYPDTESGEIKITGKMKGLNPGTEYTVKIAKEWTRSPKWSVVGEWTIEFIDDVRVDGNPWTHKMNVTEQNMANGRIKGDGYYKGDPQITWVIKDDSRVIGDEFFLELTYTGENSGYYLDCQAVIDGGKLVNGTYKEDADGTFSSTEGRANREAVGDGWPGLFHEQELFKFTTDENGEGEWSKVLTAADFPPGAYHKLSVWVYDDNETVLISNNFRVTRL